MTDADTWLCRPDVCRCCLADSGGWDLTGAYMSEERGNEVLLDMLRDCLGITLSNVVEWGPSRFVCDSCARSLRRAHEFKQQVLRAEDAFATYHRRKDCINHEEIKVEEEIIKNYDRDSIDRSYSEDVTKENPLKQHPSRVKEHNLRHNFTKKHMKKNNCKQKAKDCCLVFVASSDDKHMAEISPTGKHLAEIGPNDKYLAELGSGEKHMSKMINEYKFVGKITDTLLGNTESDKKIAKITDVDYDSDTPISQLSKEIKHNQNDDFSLAKEVKSDENESCQMINSATEARQWLKDPAKRVSERKRIRMTCETVLKDTTACPFRHHKSWFQCFYCTLDFMEINMLRQHTLQKHKSEDVASIKRYPRSLQIDITDLRCKICSVNLIDVINMVKHFAEVHNKVVYKECIADYKVNTSPYTCHICCKQYHVFRTLTTHLNEHYANCICDVCGKSFLNSKRLKVHKRTHESGNFPCKECGKVLKTKTSKANHMESHSKRVIKCHLCLKPMKHYNDRIKHMSEEHNITHKFKCLICGREYKIKHYLATHMRQTHGHKNKKCSECGMAFITNHGLKKHMLKHTGVKAFACTICNKAYARSYTLREHMRGHDGEAKFEGS